MLVPRRRKVAVVQYLVAVDASSRALATFLASLVPHATSVAIEDLGDQAFGVTVTLQTSTDADLTFQVSPNDEYFDPYTTASEVLSAYPLAIRPLRNDSLLEAWTKSIDSVMAAAEFSYVKIANGHVTINRLAPMGPFGMDVRASGFDGELDPPPWPIIPGDSLVDQ